MPRETKQNDITSPELSGKVNHRNDFKYIVYKHTNIVNGKVYIGITRNNIELRAGKNGHRYKKNVLFSRAIEKYGWDKFRHDVVCENLTLAEASAMEQKLIEEYHSNDSKYGYNLSSGGEGGNTGCTISDEWRKRRSEWYSGKNNPCYGKFGASHPAYGCKHSEESKEAVRRALLGRKYSEETLQKMRAADKSYAYRRVICIETGVVFDSVKDAALSVNKAPTNITACCKGKQQTVSGLHWAYYGDDKEVQNAS